MKFLPEDLNLINYPKVLTQIFDQEVPLTETDVVMIYVNVVGHKDRQMMVQRSFAKKIYGSNVNGRGFSAIQQSTAAGLLSMLEIFNGGGLHNGFVKQEAVALSQFLATQWGARIYSPDYPIDIPCD